MPPAREPPDDNSTDPVIDLVYANEIEGKPSDLWPWIVHVGYHRGGWRIDKWWDRIEQDIFWLRLVPAQERGKWQPPARTILPECQDLNQGNISPDGPRDSTYHEAVVAFADGQRNGHSVVAEVLSHTAGAKRIAVQAWEGNLAVGQAPVEWLEDACHRIQEASLTCPARCA